MSFLDKIQEQWSGKKSIAGKRSKTANGMQEADILDTLRQEHDDVQDMLERLQDIEKSAERTSLFKQIKAALVPHVRAEEKVVYDRILALKDKDAKMNGNEGYFEHQAADMMIAKLSKIKNKMSPEWSAGAKVLKELVDHHIDEEENNVWPNVRDNFSAEERQEMAREFEAAKKRVKIP